MNRNVLRQLVDIQLQAERISKDSVTVNDIENFSKFSIEMKNYLLQNIDESEIIKYVKEIPEVPENNLSLNKGLIAVLIPNFLLQWYYEKSYIDEARRIIMMSKGKFASIEFLLKNYLE